MAEQEFELRTDSEAFPLECASSLANVGLLSKIALEGLRGQRYKSSKCQITWDLGSYHGHTEVS